MLEKFFKLRENNTNVKTEVMAGITTFMTMAYILVGCMLGWCRSSRIISASLPFANTSALLRRMALAPFTVAIFSTSIAYI